MLILQAKKINMEKQTLTATDGRKEFHVFIPRSTPQRTPEAGEFVIVGKAGKQFILEGVVEAGGGIQKPGAWNLYCKSLNIQVDGREAWIPSSPGWAF